ncbi:hypothetical protein [Gellertiella hungarica]|uniref:Uncharacterized protein n=1 Tax=Gellertiella hungarica TaxID=1572859 RepID=A0A7W6J3E4_9HYPH|nr:hypothetical protein [Gellertiella hungarica]MBB4064024.1 hypothetical protein [Gellertiella hungarica]
MSDFTPRQAVDAYLGGEALDPFVLRAAVAQLVAAYDEVTDLAFDAVDDPMNAKAFGELATELLHQQTLLEDFLVSTDAVTALPDLIRSRPTRKTTRV